MRVWWIAVCVWLVGSGAQAQTAPLSVCLARESVGVAAGEIQTALDKGRTSDHGILFINAASRNLQRFGATVSTLKTKLTDPGSVDGLQYALAEADTRKMTMMVGIGVTITESRIINPYVGKDPYPLRTVTLSVQAWVVDVVSGDVIGEITLPPRHMASMSSDEAVSQFLTDDLADPLARLMQQACIGRTPPPVASTRQNQLAEQTAPPDPPMATKGEPIPIPKPDPAHPGRHIFLAFGVKDYKNLGTAPTAKSQLTNLSYADKDAKDFATFFPKPVWTPRVFTNEQATAGTMLRAFDVYINNADKNDVIVLFFSGHGRLNPLNQKRNYLLPYDFEPDNPQSGIDVSELLRQIDQSPALQIIVFLDACFSGMDPLSKGSPAVLGKDLYEIESKAGHMRIVMTSSSGDQLSNESDDYQNGLFTYYLKAGMRNKDLMVKDQETRRMYLPLRKLSDYVTEQMRSESIKPNSRIYQIPDVKGDKGSQFTAWPILVE